MKIIPYPLRAASFSLKFAPFAFWWPSFTHRRSLTEVARANGETTRSFRIACFQISYARML